MSDHHHADATGDNNLGTAADLENPLLSPPPRPRDSTPATLPALIPLFLLLAAAALSLVATVTLILSVQILYEVDSLHVSSFNISDNSWSANLSFNQSERGLFADHDVAYEARSWLYSRSGFVSVNTPSMSRGRGGGGLVLHSNFTMREFVAEGEAAAGDGTVILDLLIEANATSGSGTASYLMIECRDLEIEFAADRSSGMLSGGGAERCGVQVYATKSDALQGGRIVIC